MINNDLTKGIVNISFNELNDIQINKLFNQRQKYNKNSFFDSLLIFLINKKIQEVNIFVKKNSYILKFIKSNIYKDFIKLNFIFKKKLPKNCLLITKKFFNNKDYIYKYKKEYFIKNFFWPRLNIVTTNLNHGKYIKRTIFSITKQNYPNYKIFIIDSDSTDKSHSILNQLKKIYYLKIFIRKDEDIFEGLNFFFNKTKIPTNEFLGLLPNTDIFFENSLFNIGLEILKNHNCVGIGGSAKPVKKYDHNYNLKFSKKKFFIFKKKDLYNLDKLPAGQCFFFKFSYLLKSKSFFIKGCHTNTFILIILNAINDKKIILTTKSHLAGYVYHKDHSSNFQESRGQYIFSSRKTLINEIISQKLLNNQEITKLMKVFQSQELYYYLSHFRIEKNKILRFLKKTKLSIFESFIVLFKAIYGKLSYIYQKYC